MAQYSQRVCPDAALPRARAMFVTRGALWGWCIKVSTMVEVWVGSLSEERAARIIYCPDPNIGG